MRFDSHNNIISRFKSLLEQEWVEEESAFRALAQAAGLRVFELRCVGFHGAEAGAWTDRSASVENVARQALANSQDPRSSDLIKADGTLTAEFKHGVTEKLTDNHNDTIMDVSEEDVLVGATLVAILKV